MGDTKCPNCLGDGRCWPADFETDCVCCLKKFLRALLIALGGEATFSLGCLDPTPWLAVRAGAAITRLGPGVTLSLYPIGDLAEQINNSPAGGQFDPHRPRIGRDQLRAYRGIFEPEEE